MFRNAITARNISHYLEVSERMVSIAMRFIQFTSTMCIAVQSTDDSCIAAQSTNATCIAVRPVRIAAPYVNRQCQSAVIQENCLYFSPMWVAVFCFLPYVTLNSEYIAKIIPVGLQQLKKHSCQNINHRSQYINHRWQNIGLSLYLSD